jgi:hypothetical protein
MQAPAGTRVGADDVLSAYRALMEQLRGRRIYLYPRAAHVCDAGCLQFEYRGDLSICLHTLDVHICGPDRCRRLVVDGGGHRVCTVTARVFPLELCDDTWRPETGPSADLGDCDYAGGDGDGDGDDGGRVSRKRKRANDADDDDGENGAGNVVVGGDSEEVADVEVGREEMRAIAAVVHAEEAALHAPSAAPAPGGAVGAGPRRGGGRRKKVQSTRIEDYDKKAVAMREAILGVIRRQTPTFSDDAFVIYVLRVCQRFWHLVHSSGVMEKSKFSYTAENHAVIMLYYCMTGIPYIVDNKGLDAHERRQHTYILPKLSALERLLPRGNRLSSRQRTVTLTGTTRVRTVVRRGRTKSGLWEQSRLTRTRRWLKICVGSYSFDRIQEFVKTLPKPPPGYV